MGKKRVRNRAAEKANQKEDRKEVKKVPKGLINVGNTCYFNSALQCLSRVSALQKWIKYLSSGGSLGILKRSSNDGNTQTLRLSLPKDDLQFSRTFVNFVEDLLGSNNTRSSITPECLRKQLVTHYKQLGNNAQHDSHEALRCILDRLRFEEKRVWQRAILDGKKYTASASEELREDIKSWGQCTALSTTVDRTFGGVLLSSIQCTICKNVSIRFETFLDLSLPISIDNSEPDLSPQKADCGKRKKNTDKMEEKSVQMDQSKECKAEGDGDGEGFIPELMSSIVDDNDDDNNDNQESAKKSKKGKKSRNKHNFGPEDSEFAGNGDQNHSGPTNNNNHKVNAKNGKRSTRKKHARNWYSEDSDICNTDEEECESYQESEMKQWEGKEPVQGGNEQPERLGSQNAGGDFAVTDLNAKEEDEDTFLPKMVQFSDYSDNDDGDNASLEPNHGSISDCRDIVVGELDGDSNKSTGSPESVAEFSREEAVGFDDRGLRKDNEEEPDSPLSSVESEKKSLGSTSTGDAADMEDNADDGDGLSTISIPKITAFDEEAFCKEFSSKSRLADAGNKTPIAQPEEEKRAKELSISSILEQQGKDQLTGLEQCLMKYFEVEELIGDNRITCDECTKKAQASGGEIDDCRSTTGSDGSIRCDSLRRDLLLKPPAILTIQLKRYQRNGYQLRKCNKSVSFPINLDIRPYCSRLAWLGEGEGQYRLFGIVEHLGSLSNGHYVAYVAENTDGDVPADCFIPALDKPFPWPLNLHHLVYQLRRGDQSVLNGDTETSKLSDQEDNRTWYYFSDTTVRRVTLPEVLNAKPYLLFYQRVR